MTPVLRWLRAHGHHLLFAMSLLSLIALATWWAVFLAGAVKRERTLLLDALAASAGLHAHYLDRLGGSGPAVGPLAADGRLEVSTSPSYGPELSVSLEPSWPGLYIQPRADVVAGWDTQGRRRLVMVTGESALLVVLLFVSCFMLYRLIQAERRAHAEVREFWGRVTHEIKTPIAGLKAFLQTLQRRGLPPEDFDRYVDMALRQVTRQERLAMNLLVGQQLGYRGPATSRVDLDRFFEGFAHEHALELVGRVVRVARMDGLAVVADPQALDAIVTNLTDNAIRHGGEGACLEITAAVRGGRIEICFSDDGAGFQPRSAEVLFEAYRRLEPAGSRAGAPRQGAGLGLHIARRLARRMGGDLTACSRGHGQGAVFRLVLPRSRV